jgi:hypothetical protein
VAVWPTETVSPEGSEVIAGIGDTPVPAIEMVFWMVVTVAAPEPPEPENCGELVSFSVMTRLPETSPGVGGAKRVVKVALCPWPSVSGSPGPEIVKARAEAMMLVITVGPPLEFFRVRLWLLVAPTVTFPKFRSDWLRLRLPASETQPDCVRADTRAARNSKKVKDLWHVAATVAHVSNPVELRFTSLITFTSPITASPITRPV